MIPIFLISLKDKQERRNSVLAGFHQYGIDEIKICDAVDGRKENLDAYNIDRRKFHIFWHNPIFFCVYWRMYSNSEYGCALSHLKLYQHILDHKIPLALIVEDDTFPKDQAGADLIKYLDELYQQHPFEILFLDYDDKLRRLQDRKFKFMGFDITRVGSPLFNFILNRRKAVYRTSCYAVSLKGAQKLLKKGYPVRMPADILTGLIAYNKLDAWKVQPYPCQNTLAPSDIVRAHQMAGNKKSFIRKITFKNIIRLFKA